MSAALPVLDAEHPWPGLFPYGEEAHQYFNGRERETTDLLRLVRRDACTLLYGQSGLGKSSLLRAGLFPRLRDEGFLPVYLRLDFRDPSLPLRQQAWSILRDAMTRARIDGRMPTDDESFWAYFHSTDVELWDPQNRMVTPVLVFDQFEEMVQAAEERAQSSRLAAFMDELADLIENRVPAEITERLERDPDAVSAIDFSARRFRCVLGFREDFLPDLEERFAAHRIATISRLRITKMGESQALQAVLKTGGALVDEMVARRIVEFVSAAGSKSARVIEIEPALLSVVCFELNNRRIGHGEKRISADLLEGAQEAIIAEFYQRGTDGLDPAVQVFIERELLTESGYRDSCAVEDAVQRFGVPLTVIQSLVERRILRLEERFGVLRVELTHDVLAPVVRTNRDQRLAEAAAAAERERDKVRQRQILRWVWAGGSVAAVAVSLMVVFFTMYRQAEGEKARVIEAQSNLFLSRANSSLDDNVPGEPYRHLAAALALNPENHGAIARLSNLMIQRRYARPLWSWPMPPGAEGQGVGVVMPAGEDGFAFLVPGESLLVANIRQGAHVPALEFACANRRWPKLDASAESPLFTRAALPVPSPAPQADGVRVRAMEYAWPTSSAGAEQNPAATQDKLVQAALRECSRARGRPDAARTARSNPARGAQTPPLRPLVVEPGATHVWTERAGRLLRVSTAGQGAVSEVAIDIDDALGSLKAAWSATEGRALLLQGTRSASLYRREGKQVVQAASFADAGADGAKPIIDAQFDADGRHALMVFRDGTCEVRVVSSSRVSWRRKCAGDIHRFVPGKPWVAMIGDRRDAALGNREVPRSELVILDVADGKQLGLLNRPLPINHVGFSTDVKKVVVSAQDRTAEVFSLPELAVQGDAMLHEGAVVEAHFLPGDERVATASFDGSARVWNWRTATLAVEPMVHEGPVVFARPVLGGTHVLTTSDDRRLRLWRLQPPSDPVFAAQPALAIAALSPKGDLLAHVNVNDEKAAGRGNRIMAAAWSERPGTAGPIANIRELRLARGAVGLLDFSADGSTLLVAGVEPWLEVVPVGGGEVREVRLPAPVRKVVHVPAQNMVVAQLEDNSVRGYDLATGRQAGLGYHGERNLLDFGVSADGRYTTVVTHGEARVLDTRTGYWLSHLPLRNAQFAAVHPFKPEVVASTRTQLLLWRAKIGAATSSLDDAQEEGEESDAERKLVERVERGGGRIINPGRRLLGLRFAPDGSAVAAYSIDGVVATWSADTLATGVQIRHSTAVTGLDWSADGRWLITRAIEGTARVWDHRSGQLMSDPMPLPATDSEFRLIGRGTWALMETSPGSLTPRLVGVGFKGGAPSWLVPTAGALGGVGAARLVNMQLQEGVDAAWWDAWLAYVAQRNGAGTQ